MPQTVLLRSELSPAFESRSALAGCFWFFREKKVLTLHESDKAKKPRFQRYTTVALGATRHGREQSPPVMRNKNGKSIEEVDRLVERHRKLTSIGLEHTTQDMATARSFTL
jgi:hypothetical protein